jgi:NADH dehydrogenase
MTDTKIVILGSGFAGIEVLKNLQKKFIDNKNDARIDITLVSKDNFLLFTPMLPEVATGIIETRHIVTQVRAFCKKAKFYEAKVDTIDFRNKKVGVKHEIGNHFNPSDIHAHILDYDYLAIALGSETNFFGMADIERNCFTMKSIDDAIILRNHIISVLEQASIEQDNKDLRKSLLTFIVVGGGFSGIETVGALNDFIRETVREFYKNICITDIRIVLVVDDDKILVDIDKELGEFALQKLKDRGVEFMMNTQVNGATPNSTKLNNGIVIPSYTLIWTAGVTVGNFIANLECGHDKSGKILANSFLEVIGHTGVYALGDCASITDAKTGKPYPSTAQHAIRQGKVAAMNIIAAVNEKRKGKKKKAEFDYKTRGVMAEIGKRTGVAIIFGLKFQGFTAWWLWRIFYLANMPTTKKKLKVMVDWIMDLLFKPDVVRIRRRRLSIKKTRIHMEKS